MHTGIKRTAIKARIGSNYSKLPRIQGAGVSEFSLVWFPPYHAIAPSGAFLYRQAVDTSMGRSTQTQSRSAQPTRRCRPSGPQEGGQVQL